MREIFLHPRSIVKWGQFSLSFLHWSCHGAGMSVHKRIASCPIHIAALEGSVRGSRSLRSVRCADGRLSRVSPSGGLRHVASFRGQWSGRGLQVPRQVAGSRGSSGLILQHATACGAGNVSEPCFLLSCDAAAGRRPGLRPPGGGDVLRSGAFCGHKAAGWRARGGPRALHRPPWQGGFRCAARRLLSQALRWRRLPPRSPGFRGDAFAARRAGGDQGLPPRRKHTMCSRSRRACEHERQLRSLRGRCPGTSSRPSAEPEDGLREPPSRATLHRVVRPRGARGCARPRARPGACRRRQARRQRPPRDRGPHASGASFALLNFDDGELAATSSSAPMFAAR